MTCEARNKRKVEVETVHEPLNCRGRVTGENLDKLRADKVTSGKRSILVELLRRVLQQQVLKLLPAKLYTHRDVVLNLSARESTIDARRSFRGVASKEVVLVQ